MITEGKSENGNKYEKYIFSRDLQQTVSPANLTFDRTVQRIAFRTRMLERIKGKGRLKGVAGAQCWGKGGGEHSLAHILNIQVTEPVGP